MSEEKKHLVTFDLKILFWDLEIKFVENYFFLKNYVTSEGAVSHNVLYFQQLSIGRCHSKFLCEQLFWVIANSVQCF